jgi:thiamine-monophosphate kinase
MTRSPTEDTPGEFDIIREIFAPLSANEMGAFNLTDDAAILSPPPGTDLVMTKDAMVSGVHFFAEDEPGNIARKLLRVNLSDLAAMGATPMGYLLATFWEQGTDPNWIRDFAKGLEQDQQEYNVGLLGGDTVTTPGPLSLSLTAIGNVPIDKTLRRNGARAGDLIVVSGSIGDSALGLKVLRGELDFLSVADKTFLVDRYHLPQPRLTLGTALRGVASSCIDISDGLIADISHVSKASSALAIIEADMLPLSDAATAALTEDEELLTILLTGGDDYELAFTIPPKFQSRLSKLSEETQTRLTCIGRIEDGSGTNVLNKGTPLSLSASGWRHF